MGGDDHREVSPLERKSMWLFKEESTWFMVLGILFIMLGTVALGVAIMIATSSILIVGGVLLVASLLQFLNALHCRGGGASVFHFLLALCYGSLGVVAIYRPLFDVESIVGFFSMGFIVVGFLRVILCYKTQIVKGQERAFSIGISSLFVGFLILLNWAPDKEALIGLLVSIDVILHGSIYVFIGVFSIEEVVNDYS